MSDDIQEWYFPVVEFKARKTDSGWTVGSVSLEGTKDERWIPIEDFTTEQAATDYLSKHHPHRRIQLLWGTKK